MKREPLTRDEIDFRRHIDELVGQHIIGRSIYIDGPNMRLMHSYFSSHMLDCWRVVDTLRYQGWRVSVSEVKTDDWNCRFTPADTSRYVYATADTPELAICLAALAVVGIEVS